MPPVPVGAVARERLVRRLDALPARLLVEGPTGSGGSTLVAAWARRREEQGDAVVWCEGRGPGEVPRADPGRRGIVVVDRGERLDLDEVRRVVAACAAVPETHLVVLARPASLWVRTDVVDGPIGERLSGADLAATAEEVPALATAWGHAVAPGDVPHLLEVSGGWLTGLRAFLDTRRADGSADLDSACLRVLTVGGLEPAYPEAAFVAVGTALLDDFDLGDARAACVGARLGEPELVATIDAMLRHGLLRPAGARWRLTGLMRHFARDVLADDPALRASTARRLARHRHGRLCAEGGATPGTVARLARVGEDWDLLADLWASAVHHAVRGEDHDTVPAAYADLPSAVLAAHPVLAVAADVAAGRQASLAGTARPAAAASADHAVVLLTHRARAARHAGDLVAALATVRALDEEVERRGAAGDLEGAPAAATRHEEAGLVLLSAGDEAAAVPRLERAYAAGRDRAAWVLALVHRSRGGDPAVAAAWAERGDAERFPALAAALAHTTALDELDLAAAEDARGRWHRARTAAVAAETWPLDVALEAAHLQIAGRYDEVGVLLARTAEWHAAEVAQRGRLARLVERGTAEALLAAREPHRLEAWLTRCRRPDGSLPAWLEVPAAWLLLRTGHPRRARLAARAGRQRSQRSARDRADLDLAAAVAHRAEGDLAAARAQVPADAPLAAWARLAHEELADLWRGRPVPPVLTDRASADPDLGRVALTPRERVVLQHLAHHDGAAAISRELTVSVNTVKKQLVSAYAKLGVHSRQDALLAARRLGLLDE